MGNKCCTHNSTLNCDFNDHHEYAIGGHIRKGGRSIRQTSIKQHRNIEGMKRQIDENNQTNQMNASKISAFNLVDSAVEENQMSFLKGADPAQDVVKDTMAFNPIGFAQTGIFGEPQTDEYMEWDKVTNRNEENFEISSDARDYNNQSIDETQSEIMLDDGNEPENTNVTDAYVDSTLKVDGGMASTEPFTLWRNLMPVFAELTRLDYYKEEISAGRKQYKDFYVNFRENHLPKFDQAVAGNGQYIEVSDVNADIDNHEGFPINLKFWLDLPWDIRVKTFLTLYAVENQAKTDNDLSEREVNILRWAALLLHIGCAKKSKTSKIYVYSFLSALFIIQMLESGDMP